MTKRLVDIGLGSLLAILAVPLILVLALISALAFKAWPFFVQTRVGHRGKNFRIVKIRTLPRCAPSAVDKFALAQIPLPRVATLMHSTHLDELPQLFLVPLGAMSLVGPRPEMPFLHEQGAREFAELRVSIRPGCTGLWQVSRAARGLIWDASEYDVYYLNHRTVRLDLWILLQTALLALGRSTSLQVSDVPAWTSRPLGRLRQSGNLQVLPSPYPKDSLLPAQHALSVADAPLVQSPTEIGPTPAAQE